MATLLQETNTLSFCQLVHRIPGRVRFRVPLLGRSPEIAEQLLSVLTNISGITSIRVNLAASSLVIQYQIEIESSIDKLFFQALLDCLQHPSVKGRQPQENADSTISSQHSPDNCQLSTVNCQNMKGSGQVCACQQRLHFCHFSAGFLDLDCCVPWQQLPF